LARIRSTVGDRPVFVDPTGRRRRLFTVVGILLGVAITAAFALLIAGVLGAPPVPLPGLPVSDQGVQERAPAVPVEATPAGPSQSQSPVPPGRVPAAPAPSGTPSVTGAAPSSQAPSATPTARGNRPTVHPGNPKSSRSK
jgi:hypothetical protein